VCGENDRSRSPKRTIDFLLINRLLDVFVIVILVVSLIFLVRGPGRGILCTPGPGLLWKQDVVVFRVGPVPRFHFFLPSAGKLRDIQDGGVCVIHFVLML